MKVIYHPFVRANAMLRQQSLLRKLPKNKKYLYDFSHNDYLGYSAHPALVQTVKQFNVLQGVGSRASRLISLKQDPIKALENQIAQSKGGVSALIFATGFQANASILSSVLDKKLYGQVPLVFSDRLNHASMHLGCKIANVKQIRYHHLDTDHLYYLLKQYPRAHPKFIITESVFGMDGDIAPLESILKLAHDFNALLYVDEAHATGLFGRSGYGCTEDLKGEVDIVMGTFSKALGTSGAYCVFPHVIKRYLVNRCLGLIYSTAPSPLNIALMQTAWDLIPSSQSLIPKLMQTAQSLREYCATLGFNTGSSSTHIVPIILKDPQLVLKAQRCLQQYQVHVGAIRPPSVGSQQSRLRIALSTEHDKSAIEALKNALKSLSYFCDRKYTLDRADLEDNI